MWVVRNFNFNSNIIRACEYMKFALAREERQWTVFKTSHRGNSQTGNFASDTVTAFGTITLLAILKKTLKVSIVDFLFTALPKANIFCLGLTVNGYRCISSQGHCFL